MNYRETDPEFAERFEHFTFEEVVQEEGQQLEETTRHMAIIATLLGCQGIDEFKLEVPRALDGGLTPVTVNEILIQKGVKLPLEGQATTTMEDRLEKGAQAQVDIFGEGMREAWKNGHINRWLAANCFGDYYTRTGLNLAQREMITFCFLAAQGGCEPQLIAHAGGNMNLGNDKEFLTKVVSQCLPYIGYPRSLNAITCINKAAEARKDS